MVESTLFAGEIRWNPPMCAMFFSETALKNPHFGSWNVFFLVKPPNPRCPVAKIPSGVSASAPRRPGPWSGGGLKPWKIMENHRKTKNNHGKPWENYGFKNQPLAKIDVEAKQWMIMNLKNKCRSSFRMKLGSPWGNGLRQTGLVCCFDSFVEGFSCEPDDIPIRIPILVREIHHGRFLRPQRCPWHCSKAWDSGVQKSQVFMVRYIRSLQTTNMAMEYVHGKNRVII